MGEPAGRRSPHGGTVRLGSTLTLLGNSTTQTGGSLELHDGSYTFTRSQVSLHGMVGSVLAMSLGAPVPKAYTPGEITFESQDTKHGFACKDLKLEKVVFEQPYMGLLPQTFFPKQLSNLETNTK